MRNVIFLPGIIAPAALRYAPLLARLSNIEALTKDLEVYSFDAPRNGCGSHARCRNATPWSHENSRSAGNPAGRHLTSV